MVPSTLTHTAHPQKTPRSIKPTPLAPSTHVPASTPKPRPAAHVLASTPRPRPTTNLSPTPLQPTSTPAPSPTANSPAPNVRPAPAVPTRLIIPAINLDAPVIAVGWSNAEINGQQVSEWDVPTWRAAGWLKTSALLGMPGNTVLEGHQDIDGRVFEELENLKEGDTIQVLTESFARTYVIALKTIVPERDQPLEVRRENARWIGPSNDERITLVTCWPRNDNTHRLILVALPAP